MIVFLLYGEGFIVVCFSKIKTFSTLASRWKAANCGESGQGLSRARAKQVSRFDEAFKYLAKLYLKQLQKLITIEANKAYKTDHQRKTIRAKTNAWQRVNNILDDIVKSFSKTGYPLPGMERSVTKARIVIDNQKRGLLSS